MNRLLLAISVVIFTWGCSETGLDDSPAQDAGADVVDPAPQPCHVTLSGQDTSEQGEAGARFFNAMNEVVTVTRGDESIDIPPRDSGSFLLDSGVHALTLKSERKQGTLELDVSANQRQTVWLTYGPRECIAAQRKLVEQGRSTLVWLVNLTDETIQVSTDANAYQTVPANEISTVLDRDIALHVKIEDAPLRFDHRHYGPMVSFLMYDESLGAYVIITEDGAVEQAPRDIWVHMFTKAYNRGLVCAGECREFNLQWGRDQYAALPIGPINEVVLNEDVVAKDISPETIGPLDATVRLFLFDIDSVPVYSVLPFEIPHSPDIVTVFNVTDEPVMVSPGAVDPPILPGERRHILHALSYSAMTADGLSVVDTPPELRFSLVVFEAPNSGKNTIGLLASPPIWTGDRKAGESCSHMDPCDRDSYCVISGEDGVCLPRCDYHTDCGPTEICDYEFGTLGKVCNPSETLQATIGGRAGETRARGQWGFSYIRDFDWPVDITPGGFGTSILRLGATHAGSWSGNPVLEVRVNNLREGTIPVTATGIVPPSISPGIGSEMTIVGRGELTIKSMDPLSGGLTLYTHRQQRMWIAPTPPPELLPGKK